MTNIRHLPVVAPAAAPAASLDFGVGELLTVLEDLCVYYDEQGYIAGTTLVGERLLRLLRSQSPDTAAFLLQLIESHIAPTLPPAPAPGPDAA